MPSTPIKNLNTSKSILSSIKLWQVILLIGGIAAAIFGVMGKGKTTAALVIAAAIIGFLIYKLSEKISAPRVIPKKRYGFILETLKQFHGQRIDMFVAPNSKDVSELSEQISFLLRSSNWDLRISSAASIPGLEDSGIVISYRNDLFEEAVKALEEVLTTSGIEDVKVEKVNTSSKLVILTVWPK